MSDIAKLYEEVMADSEVEKTASDVSKQNSTFDHDFFEKVASGDEAATDELSEFIETARAEGYDDDAIEAAIGEAMEEDGFEVSNEEIEEQPSDFELQKAASYEQGSHKAIEDVLEKAAELGVSEQDIADFYLGSSYGEGYAETRQELEMAVEKIASRVGDTVRAGAEGARALMGRAAEGAKAGGKRYKTLMQGGAAGKRSMRDTFEGLKDKELRGEILKSMGTRGLTAAGATGATVGTVKAVRGDKK